MCRTIPCRSAAHAAALVEYLTSEGEHATWLRRDRAIRGPSIVVLTMAEPDLIAAARAHLA